MASFDKRAAKLLSAILLSFTVLQASAMAGNVIWIKEFDVPIGEAAKIKECAVIAIKLVGSLEIDKQTLHYSSALIGFSLKAQNAGELSLSGNIKRVSGTIGRITFSGPSAVLPNGADERINNVVPVLRHALESQCK
jgi:hypothetical protein